MSELKAIETVYKGYKFRSRLEARWARFFDALDIRWEYEKEGYNLPGGVFEEDFFNNKVQVIGGYYLPDFWLPDLDCWIEIKGEEPTERERSLAMQLAIESEKHVHIFYGAIPMPVDGHMEPENDSALTYFPDGYGMVDFPYHWCECPYCGQIGLHWSGLADRIKCGCIAKKHGKDYSWGNFDTPRLVEAYTAARQARFEHNR